MASKRHHPLGLSGAARYTRCTGSVELSRGLDSGGSAADIGTATHALGESALMERTDPQDALGTRDPETGVTITQDMIDVAIDYVDAVTNPSRVALALGEKPEDLKMLRQWVELTVDLDEWIPAAMSTLDHAAIWYTPKRSYLVVSDLKSGRTKVDAPGNEQLYGYAGALIHTIESEYRIDEVCVAIIMPRIDHYDYEVVTPATIRRFMERLRGIAKKVDSGDTELNPGPKQCQWCRGRAKCPAYAEWVFNAVEGIDREITAKAPVAMTDEQLANALAQVDTVAAWAKELKEHALAEVLNGREIPGWKPVHGRSIRAWRDEDAMVRYMTGIGYGSEQLYERSILSPAKVEKLVGKKLWKESELDELTEKPTGKPTLVPASDKRPAISDATFCDFD